jgi:hypothetical protein
MSPGRPEERENASVVIDTERKKKETAYTTERVQQ